MSHVDASPLSMYNSLSDPHLAGYFANTRMRNHLRRTGLITRRGQIVPDNHYRLNQARKEHKKHVKDLLAHAIVEKTLDLERHRQVAIRQKLEEIAKMELVQRIKEDRKEKVFHEALFPLLTPRKGSGKGEEKSNDKMAQNEPPTPRSARFSEDDVILEERTHRQRRNDEDILPYLSPRSSRPQSGPSPRSRRSNRAKYRPVSAPSNMPPDTNSSMYESNDDDEDVTYVDEHGNPVEWSEGEYSSRGRARTPRSKEDADVRHLYSLNPGELRRYATELARMEQTNALVSPYLIPQIPLPPSSPRTPRGGDRRQRRFRSSSADKSPKRGMGPELHPRHGPMMHQGDIHSMCKVRMKYHGWALNLAREQMDPRQEVHVEQQHCGGNTLPVFRDLLVPGSEFTFISKRHRGYPFSLTLYVDGRQDARVSTCCEMGHSKNVRLGGKQGHFSIISIQDVMPCYKCQVKKGLKGKKAPRKQLKHPPKGETGEEVIVMETKPRSPRKKDEEEAKSDDESSDSAVEQILVPVEVEGVDKQAATVPDDYEDDFDDDEDDDKAEEPDEDVKEHSDVSDSPDKETISNSTDTLTGEHVLYSKSWDENKDKARESPSKEEKKKSSAEQVEEDKRQIRGLADDFEVDMTGDGKRASVPAEKSATPSIPDDYEEERGRKVEGYSSEEEDLEGEKNKVVEVEKKTEKSDTPVRKGSPKQRNGDSKGRMNTSPKHKRILTLDASKREDVEREVYVERTRTPSPPLAAHNKPSRDSDQRNPSQQVKPTPEPTGAVEDRDADYSSESSSSSPSSSSDEGESSERPPTQGRESSQSKDDRTEPELEAIAQSNRSSSITESSESSAASARSEEERKVESIPERPQSPVAVTLMKEEEQEAGKNFETEKKEEFYPPAAVVNEEKPPPVVLTRAEGRFQDGETPRSTTTTSESSTESSTEVDTDRSGKQTMKQRPQKVEAVEQKSKSNTESDKSTTSNTDSSTDESTPRQEKTISDQIKPKDNQTGPSTTETSSSSSSGSDSDASTPRADTVKDSKTEEPTIKKDEKFQSSSPPSSSSSSSSGSESESTPRSKTSAAAKQADTGRSSPQESPVQETEVNQGMASATVESQDQDITQEHSSSSPSQQEGREQSEQTQDTLQAGDETKPGTDDEDKSEQTQETLPQAVGDEDKSEDNGLAVKVGKAEASHTEDSSSDSDSSSSSSSGSSSSSSSSDESATEGELIVQEETPRGPEVKVQMSQRSEDTDAGPENGDTTALTDGDTTVRSETSDGDTERAETSAKSGTDDNTATNGLTRSLPSQPRSPPHSPTQDHINEEQQRVIPPVVIIPNTPEVTDTPRGLDLVERVASPLPGRSGKVPEQFEYKSKHDTTDDEDQQRRQSESEPDTMHGGNDPDNVAENDSANWKGSMEFSAPPEQTGHQGSISPLLDNSDDLQISNISLTKPQLVEVLQHLEMKDTVHTLNLSNDSLGLEEMRMLMQSLATTSAKPTVVNLNYNILGPASVETLVEVLKIKPSIEMLLLHGNPIGNKGLQSLVDGMLDIEYEAQKFRERESERMGGVPVTVPKGRFCQIKELDLGEASITDEGMVEIALLLESNLDLQDLSLSSSPDISQSGWRKLSASLSKNKKLKTLTLEHNKIGDGGMEVLSEGLQSNTSITSLDLAYTRIGESGGRAIIDLLKKNTTIRTLTLSPGNNIPQKTLDEINRYLQLNQAAP